MTEGTNARGESPKNFRHITVIREGDVTCVRLKHAHLDEMEIHQLGEEILSLAGPPGHKIAMSLGPDTPYCLYSVFLAKLVTIRNAVNRVGGSLVLCEVGENTFETFKATRLVDQFTFVPDFPAALAHFAKSV